MLSVELSDLLLALHKFDTTITLGNKLISRHTEVFKARRDTGSKYYNQVCTAVAERKSLASLQALRKTLKLIKISFAKILLIV